MNVNRLASDVDRLLLLEEIRIAIAALDAIEAEVSILEMACHGDELVQEFIRISQKRTPVEEYIAICRSLLSPVRGLFGLPVELLGLVFLHYLWDDLYGHPSVSPSYGHLRLTWVCRHWRDVAANTHELWSILFLKGGRCIVPEFAEMSITRAGRLPLTMHLALANELPLSLGISPAALMAHQRVDERWHVDKILPAVDDVLAIVAKHIKRCESVSLTLAVDRRFPLPLSPGIHSIPLPLLRQLTIQVRAIKDYTPIVPSGHVIRVPGLRALTFDWSFILQYENLIIPWGRLTSLNIRFQSLQCLNRLHSVVKGCPALVELSLAVRVRHKEQLLEDILPGIEPIHAPDLQSLEVMFEQYDEDGHGDLIITRFVEQLYLPRLEHLVVWGVIGLSECWRNMLGRSRCLLQTLQLDPRTSPRNPLELVSLFREVPSLSSLQLRLPEPLWGDHDIMLLVECMLKRDPSKHWPFSLPALKHLRISLGSTNHDDFAYYRNILRSVSQDISSSGSRYRASVDLADEPSSDPYGINETWLWTIREYHKEDIHW
ncbi:hypothetical protein GLOTRDRAFT_128494 [Gloeophyllum trabeum ATCC 11539]|uniref:Uncharacterized protein n=1 Tax=Gloeophyllum trabeum (strain ATCC 11539 / FP-39264 / Madison 617) TaxID=670483 RepID=S7QB61_GLOTA|nr:uncharacterized protein GLOTRDRAFT_128494 [Gloeophyllum trabeum ATCC 11539]EPQ56552.1 hypothetical protein GLOTRDRAFT_128494 [Gloeophyllum trabeum ATCC 11539]